MQHLSSHTLKTEEKVMTTAEFLDYMNSGKQVTATGIGLGRSHVVADLLAE